MKKRNHFGSFFAVLLMAAMVSTGSTVASEPGPAQTSPQASAIFAGGCFWCMEPAFDKVSGVLATISGYTGGKTVSPTYEQVSSGAGGHYEAIRVVYDPSRVSYGQLLEVFWRNVDPVDSGGQFCDRGDQYRSAIFYGTEEERSAAEASRAALEASGQLPKAIVTPILPAGPFYPAEDYHQDYYQKNSLNYKAYRYGCGRDQRLEKLWGKVPAKATP